MNFVCAECGHRWRPRTQANAVYVRCPMCRKRLEVEGRGPSWEHIHGYCYQCNSEVVGERKRYGGHTIGFIATLLTCGLALPFWILHRVAWGSAAKYKCPNCGDVVGKA